MLGIIGAFKNENIPVETITQKFEAWQQVHPQEKVYVHLIKSLFLPGDTMYCKVYLVNADGNMPSAISRVVYIDLINGNKQVLKTTVVPMSDGIGWCSVAIGKMNAGNYHIRAYTNWMRNSDASFFFDKMIAVSDVFKQAGKSSEPKPFHKTDFFFEGGQMVAGLPSRVAFKAIGTNGLSSNVTGSIRDEAGKDVVSFHSGFAGMGSFLFTALPQHIYNAVVKYQDGFEEKLPLPKAEEKGYVLAIDNMDKDNINITSSSNEAGNEVALIGQNQGKILYSSNLKLVNGTINTKVLKKKFPTGITQFTLFDDKGIPVAERLIFINHQDTLHIETTMEKSSLVKREKVKLKLHVTDNLDESVTGSFSVAVTEASMTPYDNIKDENLTTNLLLTSDLKGYVESPNYYFTNIDSDKIRALDNLLLTQGWRRFRWNELLADAPSVSRYKAENNLSLTGKVQTEKGKALPDASVNLISKSGTGFILQTNTDSAGSFRFDDLTLTGDASFALQTIRKDGSKNVIISIDSFSAPAVVYNEAVSRMFMLKDNRFEPYIVSNEKRWQELKKYGLITEDESTLKEVTVRSEKLSKIQQAVAPSYNLNGPGNADQILTYDDLFNCHELSKCLQGKLIGVTLKTVFYPNSGIRTIAYSSSGFGAPMLINVDGVDIPNDQSSLDNIPAGDIQSIEVLRTGGHLNVYGTRASGGVLVITTKKGGIDYNHLDNNSTDKSMQLTTIKGYAMRREFYSPDYSVTAANTALPDLRSTLYWKPDVVTDEDGNATLEWYNDDVAGRYNIVIEGISNDGRTGNAHISYEVK